MTHYGVQQDNLIEMSQVVFNFHVFLLPKSRAVEEKMKQKSEGYYGGQLRSVKVKFHSGAWRVGSICNSIYLVGIFFYSLCFLLALPFLPQKYSEMAQVF